MNWEHITIQPEDTETETEIKYERLEIGDWTDLEVIHVEDGKFFAQAVDDCNGEIDIGTADDLETAKKLAESWAIDQIAAMLKSLGAEGIWLVRGAKEARLEYYRPPVDPTEFDTFWINLERPMERIMLIRFPAGDGGEPGITYF